MRRARASGGRSEVSAHRTGQSAAPSASERILDAALRRIVSAGALDTSLGAIAEEAGVSKALILYHFQDRDTLLARLVERVAGQLVARLGESLEGQHSALAVDALWDWLERELKLGSIPLLVELSRDRGPAVREASRHAATRRRAATAEAVQRLFAALGLKPRVPVQLLGDVTVAFEDGLALSDRPADRRVAFDVFWLALLNLAE